MSELQNKLISPIITGRPENARPARGKTPPAAQGGASFEQLLQQSIQKTQSQSVTFSKHARARTQQRGIELSESDLHRLDSAVSRAGDKGLNNTLVFMDDTAFIVNVPSGVVVTVVDSSEQNIFTNIDGAVIV